MSMIRGYNERVQTNHVFMPRKSTASKSTALPKPARKTRTRRTAKPAAVTVKSPAVTKEKIEECIKAPTRSLKPVAKVEQPKATTVTTFKSGKVVSKELMRPTAPLIQMKDYQRDVINRWNIHRYEIQELVKDVKNTFTNIKTYFAQLEIQ
tara:strand:+ start:191 stop:643 length:453 start_codon:yes stop_codon:yes gene_type:complete